MAEFQRWVEAQSIKDQQRKLGFRNRNQGMCVLCRVNPGFRTGLTQEQRRRTLTSPFEHPLCAATQGYGTPHAHLEVHVASIYQYGTLHDVAERLKNGSFTFQQCKDYREWLHAEDVFDSDTKAEFAPKLEEQWHSRFAGRENDDMSVTSKYLVQEADATGNSMKSVVTADDVPGLIELLEDAKHFKKTYCAKVQMTFNRVQHHMHKRTKKGYIPLKSCQRKARKNCSLCKHDFPKDRLCIPRSVLICRGVARKFRISVSGRRNQLGGMLGKRSDAWQSGTTPSFAAGFGSNTHTLPNWRLPPMPEIHDDSLCPSRKCRLSMGTEREKKITAKIAQRAQRQCTGYYCVSIPASGTKHVLRSQLPGLSLSASW